MMNNYNNAFTEVYEILNCLDEEEVNKIPEEVRNVIEKNRNLDYNYEVNYDEDLSNQPMLTETKAILFNLFRDYLSTPEQKQKILKIQQEERIENEQHKQEKYNKNIFEEKKETNKTEKLEITEYKESFINKAWNYIKKLFKNNKKTN